MGRYGSHFLMDGLRQDVQGELVRRTYWAASFKVSQAPSPDAKRAGGFSQRSLGAT